MKLLDFKGVGFGYSEQAPILSQVNFSLHSGDRVLVLGGNGSGKSTFGMLAAGVLKPVEGEIYSGEAAHQVRTGIIFQNSRLQMVGANVEEDLAFGLTVLNRPSREIKERVEYFLERFGLKDKRDHGPEQLSGGELRRLALASVLITGPDVLILDEPLTMLDQGNQTVLLKMLDELVPKETAFIWLDHDLRSIRYTTSWYALTSSGILEKVSLGTLNSQSYLAEHRLQAAPLQKFEWRYPEQIRNAILGPKAIEYDFG